MEIGLKERLIGAAVLVILGVIIIPFFLKGSPSPDSSVSQAVSLPPSDSTGAIQQYTLPLSGSTAPGTPLVAAATVPAAQAATVTAAPKPAAAPVHTISRSAKPAAAAPASQPNGKWIVQAGSYGSEANADKVVKALKAHGIRAGVSRFTKAGHDYFRVRVGPYAERADADKAAAAVAKAYGGKTEVLPND